MAFRSKTFIAISNKKIIYSDVLPFWKCLKHFFDRNHNLKWLRDDYMLLGQTPREKLQVQEIENRWCAELYHSWTLTFQKNSICFDESSLKIMKSAFSFILKTLFDLKVLKFKFLSWLFDHVKKSTVRKKYMVNFQIYDVTT